MPTLMAEREVSERFPLSGSYGLVASRCFRDDEADRNLPKKSVLLKSRSSSIEIKYQ